ncbi:MAG: class Ib ribonucleoside-diphosphate reductase assembly flavoprotein NrdI [Acholeplasma sp.]|nr:class Ib ribonucleoside-diphosphate reductase assembly flavoprotein NrdI [Acholeplasma sp.]
MIVVYDSLTGQTKRFASKLGFPFVGVNEYVLSEEPIFLLTRSFNFGEVPKSTKNFLDNYSAKVIGTAVSGNRNWGTNYGRAGDVIEKTYNIPLVLKFEASGLIEDVEYIKKWIDDRIDKGDEKDGKKD